MPMFNPVPARVEDILNSPTQFAIPIYQREYKWGKEEALELIEDLESYMDTEGENLFLGNLIFEKTKDQKTFVVDGQQRTRQRTERSSARSGASRDWFGVLCWIATG
jgi:uncharacterized protein with ParB-like and HNH nuclease domain